MRLLVIEYVVTIAALLVVLVSPKSWLEKSRKIWIVFGRIARRRALASILVCLLALVVRVVVLRLMPVPEPYVHDEFSYLLAADTFALGRLSNPSHPFWPHFETFHVNQQPTYSSMYPPAQGLVLAAGRLLFGHPWFGVLFNVGVMCGALCWMLQAWLPARWALLGGLIAVIRIASLSYWGSSYWGAAVAATAGIMVLGGVPGLLGRKPRWYHALCIGLGAIILANSRPYEGLLLCLPVGVLLFIRTLSVGNPSRRNQLRRHMPLLLLVLMIGAAATLYYFWRVTGSPLRMPYQVNQQTYAMGQPFLWQSPRPHVQYRHREMREFYEAWFESYQQARSSLQGFGRATADKIRGTWLFYLGPLLTLSLAGLPRALFDRRVRLLVTAGGIGALGMLLETWYQPHYSAPFTGLIYVVFLQSMRHINCWRWHSRPIGRSLILIVPFVSITMFILAVMTRPAIHQQGIGIPAWCCAETGPSERSRLVESLTAQGGQHLIFVQYGPSHDVNREWVYNEADIDNAGIVFARDMGPENAPLIEYFKDRKVWLLEADEHPPQLKPYK
jgi:hypothetical protein